MLSEKYYFGLESSQIFQPVCIDALVEKAHSSSASAKDKAGNATPQALFPDPARSTALIKCAAETRIEDIPPRDWLLGYRYLAGYITLTIAPGGVGKSLLTILEGLSIATGKPLSGQPVKKAYPVWLYNTEDPFEELDRRVMAAAKYHKLSKHDLKDFYYSSGYDKPLTIAAYDDSGRATVNDTLINEIISQIKQREIKLFVVDPFVECHALNENDNSAISLVVQAFRKIAAETSCAISLVHHTSKGSKDARGNMDKARGASALVSAARIAHTLYPMDAKMAKAYGFSEEQAAWYVGLDDAKANLSPPSTESIWFKKESVRLHFDSEESTGTLQPVSLDCVEQQDPEEFVVEEVKALVAPGEMRSLYALSVEVTDSHPAKLPRRVILKMIQDRFAQPVSFGSLVWKLVTGKAGNGVETESITCFDIMEK